MQAFRIVARHVTHHIDAAMARKVAALMMQTLVELLFLGDRLEFNHCEVAALLERPIFIEDIGNAARHAGSEIAAGRSDDHDDAARHIFATMIARPLDDGDRA